MDAKNDPLKTLIQFLQRLSEGDIEFEANLEAEIPGLDSADVVALNQALLALRNRLQKLSTTVDQIAEGNLGVRVTPASEKDHLGATLSRALGNLRRTFAQVIAGAEALGAAEALLAETADNTGVAVDETVTAFGNVTSHTFDQFSGIKQVNEGLEQLARVIPETDETQKTVQSIRQAMETISTGSNENAKITVGIRLTTNKMLEQVDRIVVTSRSLRGMTIGLRNTMSPYILASRQEREEALKIAYLPITDHLVLPLTYLQQVQMAGGLPLEILRRGSWPEIVDALEEEADGALILAPLAIKLYNEGLPLKIIMATHRNGSGLVLKKDLEDMEELAGRTVAVPHLHSIHNVLVYKALEKEGIGYGAVEIRQAPPPLMPYFLQRGSLDGFVSAEPFPEVALDIGAGRMEFLSKDLVPNHMCCVLVMREETLEQNPEKVVRLVNSFIKTGQRIKKNPAAAAQDVAPFYGVVPAVMERVLTTPPDRITYHELELHKEEFVDLGQTMIEMGLLSEPPDVDGLVDDRFFKQAMAQI
jgi:NitT/TauT family transport system substrate-binding protein